jgi:hypothetical protein
MGIQINGTNDTISAADGSLSVNGMTGLNIKAGSTSAPTYEGYVRVGPGDIQSLSTDGGIEFLTSVYANGYGWRVHSPDLGSGSTPFVIQSRTNTSTWTERLRVDESGRVTMPYQPMMVAYQCSGASMTVSGNSTNTLIPNDYYNPDNDMNVSTGVYTVPVTGRYLVFYGTQGKTTTNSSAGSIYYNLNDTGAGGQCLYYGDAYSGNSETIILNLTANDTIKFQIIGNNNQSYVLNGAHFGIILIG